jgi:hypothetical protein
MMCLTIHKPAKCKIYAVVAFLYTGSMRNMSAAVIYPELCAKVYDLIINTEGTV